MYGCTGAAQSVLRRPDLDDLAEVHHRDPVGDLADDGQVVGDEHVGQAELVLEVLQQVDDLGLDRDVERGDRLVGDDELGPQRQRPGDADALALAAGELVRVAARVLGREPDELQQLAHLRRDLAPRVRVVDRIGSAMLAPTRLRGFSDAYGSWKTIWMSRRTAAARARPSWRCRGRRTRRPASGR